MGKLRKRLLIRTILGDSGEASRPQSSIASSRQSGPSLHAASNRSAHLADDDKWRLVPQIDSDLEVGMKWGDMGRLYLCARKGISPLAASISMENKKRVAVLVRDAYLSDRGL